MQNKQQLQFKKARVYRHVRLIYFAYFAYVAYLHIMHIYVDNPCQLTFVFAEGLIDSDDGISTDAAAHILLMNYTVILMVKIVQMEIAIPLRLQVRLSVLVAHT